MSADCPGCWPTPKHPITRVQAQMDITPGTLYVGPTSTITYIMVGLGGQSRRIDLPEPVTLERGRYEVTIEADDTVTIERTPDA